MAIKKSQQKAVAKYMKNNYDEIKIRTFKGAKEQIQAAASNAGESTNAYIIEAIDNRMKSEGFNGLPKKLSTDESTPDETIPEQDHQIKVSRLLKLSKRVKELPISELDIDVSTSDALRHAGCELIGDVWELLCSDRDSFSNANEIIRAINNVQIDRNKRETSKNKPVPSEE